MTQPTFAFSARPIAPASPTLTPPERKRLSRQNTAILARLEQGTATNRDLAAIALKYSGRISELRDAGYDVRVVSQDRATGVTVYRLVSV